MSQLTLEIPEALVQRLEGLAANREKSVEQLALEQLSSLLEPPAESLEEQYERFFQESGLFVEVTAQEKRRYAAVSEKEREELVHKFGRGKPLSEIIMEERGET
jgi:ATP-dependent protease Clp ATPase subunit